MATGLSAARILRPGERLLTAAPKATEDRPRMAAKMVDFILIVGLVLGWLDWCWYSAETDEAAAVGKNQGNNSLIYTFL